MFKKLQKKIVKKIIIGKVNHCWYFRRVSSNTGTHCFNEIINIIKNTKYSESNLKFQWKTQNQQLKN